MRRGAPRSMLRAMRARTARATRDARATTRRDGRRTKRDGAVAARRRDARGVATKANASTWLWASECYVRGPGVEGVDVERARATRERVDAGRAALSVAPMMEYTTPHFRVMARLMSRRVMLWTEMEVDQTVTHSARDGDRVDKFLDYPAATFGTVLQLGGSTPEYLGRATAIAAPYGYDEINLNSGCPSPKVAGKGCFGAALMAEPGLVAECLAAMAENAPEGTPVSVKCRIGVDDVDSYDDLCDYVERIVAGSSTRRFYVHARKALLAGLSPAENRTVPPLKHEWAYALARDFPECEFHLNGGLKTLNDVKNVLERGPEDGGPIVGAMIGRQAHADPWGLLSAADTTLFGEASNPSASRRDFLNKYAVYADETIGRYGTAKDGYRIPSVRHMMHPIQNLFHGCANNKAWRRLVEEDLQKRSKHPDTTVRSVLDATLIAISDEDLDAPPIAAVGDAFDVNRAWELPTRGGGFLARTA